MGGPVFIAFFRTFADSNMRATKCLLHSTDMGDASGFRAVLPGTRRNEITLTG